MIRRVFIMFSNSLLSFYHNTKEKRAWVHLSTVHSACLRGSHTSYWQLGIQTPAPTHVATGDWMGTWSTLLGKPVQWIDEIEDLGVEMNHWWNHWPRHSRQVPQIWDYLVDLAVSDLIFIVFSFSWLPWTITFPFSLKPAWETPEMHLVPFSVFVLKKIF